MRHAFFVLVSVLSFAIFSAPASAGYYSVLDNGEVLESGRYKAIGDAQVLTEDGGLNLGGSFEMGFDEEFGLKGLLGFGDTDFFAGALFKWMPIPDIENQPAIGFNTGILWGKDEDVNDMTIRWEPIISKRLAIEQTIFTPYLSLPVGVRFRDSSDRNVDEDTKMTFQMVVGSQLQLEMWKNLQFIGEIGFDLDQAPGYLSVGAIMYFDGENGFTLE